MSLLIRTIAMSASLSLSLETLAISYVAFTPEDAHTLWKAMPHCAALRCIRIHDCWLCGTHEFITWIPLATQLQSVCFSSIDLPDKDCAELIRGMDKLPRLEEIELLSTWAGASSAGAIAGLHRLGRLRVLDLSRNPHLQDAGRVAEILKGFLRFPRLELQKIRLASCSPATGEEVRLVELAGLAGLAGLVVRAPRLRRLDVSYNHMGTDPTVALGKAICSSCMDTLSELGISGCLLGSEGVVGIFALLKGRCRMLSRVRVGNNWAYNEGAKAVAECLLASGKLPLKVLDLRENAISAAGATAIARLVAKRGCEYLDLSKNDIAFPGIKAVVDAVTSQTTTTVEVLDLRSNPAKDEGAEYVSTRLVKSGRTVVEVRIEQTGMGAAGARAVASAVRKRGGGVLRRISVSVEACGLDGKLALWNAQEQERKVGRAPVLDVVAATQASA